MLGRSMGIDRCLRTYSTEHNVNITLILNSVLLTLSRSSWSPLKL